MDRPHKTGEESENEQRSTAGEWQKGHGERAARIDGKRAGKMAEKKWVSHIELTGDGGDNAGSR